MGSHLLRRLALYSGAVIAGSVMVDLLRFTPWKDNHDTLLPILVLAGLALAYSIRWSAESILRRKKNVAK